MKKRLYRDWELATNVAKAKQEGSDISVIVLLQGTEIANAKQTTASLLERVRQDSQMDYTEYKMFRNMECFEIQCSPYYLDHLVKQREIQAVVSNNHTKEILEQLREG